MIIDPNTVRNLELFRNAKGGRINALLSVIDSPKTAIGAHLLEKEC
jgi:DNA mismatch repair ATPase MutS